MKIIGHRGVPAQKPENTLASYQRAVELGVKMIELDVYVCRTGELVIMHDDRIDRTTNGSGLVYEKTLKELKGFDAGEGEQIPTLQEALDLLAGKTDVNIELKGRGTGEALHAFLSRYLPERSWEPGSLLVSSFNLPMLHEFACLEPDIPIGALHGGIPINYSDFVKPMHPYSLHYNLEFIDQKMVDHAHRQGYQVYIYTVNHQDDYLRMKQMGVDGVFTNDPTAL